MCSCILSEALYGDKWSAVNVSNVMSRAWVDDNQMLQVPSQENV